MDLFSRFTSEMIEATKTMIAECEGIGYTEPYIGTSDYFQGGPGFDFDSRLVHRVLINGDSSDEIVLDVISLLERCNRAADRIWFCESSLGDLDYQYAVNLWFVTGTEEEALEKIRATAEVVRQVENI